jgi:hypothetical protein
MPTLYIPSLFKQRKRKYGKRLARARQELARFLDSFEAEAGTEAAGVLRAYAALSWGPRSAAEGLPESPPNVFDEVRRLKREVMALYRRLYSPSCFYRERKDPPYLLWHYGVTWDDLGRLAEGGVLPLEHVLRLLDVLLKGKPQLPTAESIVDLPFTTPGAGDGPELAFRRKRRRLVRLLRTALRLEEDVACRM